MKLIIEVDGEKKEIDCEKYALVTMRSKGECVVAQNMTLENMAIASDMLKAEVFKSLTIK